MSVDTPNYFAGLGQRASAPPPVAVSAPRADGLTKIDVMRAALAEQGALSARQLAGLAGLHSTALVGALFKYDLAKGRVRLHGGRYQLCDQFDADVAAAIALLKRLGYSVLPPATHREGTPCS